MQTQISLETSNLITLALKRTFEILEDKKEHRKARKELADWVNITCKEASYIQCLGMTAPVKISDLYQPTRFIENNKFFSGSENDSKNANQFGNINNNFIIYSSAGCGKSTFAKWLFLKYFYNSKIYPMLFILRWNNAVDMFSKAVNLIQNNTFNLKNKEKVVLILDGYDEVSSEIRLKISSHLRKISAFDNVHFILTCRNHYDVIDLSGITIHIKGFDERDAINFARSYFKLTNKDVDAKPVINELKSKDFSDFIESPLLLTMICVLKTSTNPDLPRNAITLIRRALDTLTYRWDEQRGVSREKVTPLDGDERVRVLMQIAHACSSLVFTESQALGTISDFLKRIQKGVINPQKVLTELSQWYGIIIPLTDGEWCFTHKTIHDYLGARLWVESGLFNSEPIKKYNAKAVYAACLTDDATGFIRKVLNLKEGLTILQQCIENSAPFDTHGVSRGIVKHFGKFKPFEYVVKNQKVLVFCKSEFFEAASDQLIIELYEMTSKSDKTEFIALHTICYDEIFSRKIHSDTLINTHLRSLTVYVERNSWRRTILEINNDRKVKIESNLRNNVLAVDELEHEFDIVFGPDD